MKLQINFSLLIFLILISSCNDKKSSSSEDINPKGKLLTDSIITEKSTNNLAESDVKEDEEYLISESLPSWVIESEVIQGSKINNKYKIQTKLNPFYIEGDFNGDKHLDVFISIKEIKTGKVGFAVIHGKTLKVSIIGAGNTIKNASSDDFSYVDTFKINHERENSGTDVDDNGDLFETPPVIIDHPSINILESEVGGGIIFWNGKEYEYLHQSC